MKTAKGAAIAISLLALVHTTGCSWILMKRAPLDHEGVPTIECSGKTAPHVDLIFAGSYLLSSATMLIAAFSPGGDQCTTEEGELFCITPREAAMIIIPVFALGALLHGLSAWSGYSWADECLQVRRKHERWLLSLSPQESQAIERGRIESRCKKLESDLKHLPTKENTMKYISECGALLRSRAERPDHLGMNELHRATRKGDRYRVGLLLRVGVDVHARDKYGWTPLHCAASVGDEKIVKMLLTKGADPLARNNENQTPIHLAHQKKHDEVVKILRSHARKRKPQKGEKLP